MEVRCGVCRSTGNLVHGMILNHPADWAPPELLHLMRRGEVLYPKCPAMGLAKRNLLGQIRTRAIPGAPRE
jgi:hypothetical protein